MQLKCCSSLQRLAMASLAETMQVEQLTCWSDLTLLQSTHLQVNSRMEVEQGEGRGSHFCLVEGEKGKKPMLSGRARQL